MKVKAVRKEIKSLDYLVVAYDISSKKHNYFTRFNVGSETMVSEGEIANRTDKIIDHFKEVAKLAKKYGFHGVRVVCEPTGGYEKNLLRRARENGFFTQYVSGEATHKAKIIESNDSGKNDQKDSRVIHMLALDDRTLTCEENDDIYGQLKFLNGKYEDLSLESSRLKNRISNVCNELFPDLGLKSHQLYYKTVNCLIQKYELNPYRIGELILGDLIKSLEDSYGRLVGGHTLTMLEGILEDAKVALKNLVPKWRSDALAAELKDYYNQRLRVEERKDNYKQQMIELVLQTDEWEKVKDTPVTVFMFSRVLAESGAWAGFPGYKQLLRYAGLNLRERQSGGFQGKVKLSKKGNGLMRKVIGQMSYSIFVKEKGLYGDYFKLQKAKRGGLYALTCVMRKALKMLLGVYKSQSVYCQERVFDQSAKLEKISA